MFNPLGAGFRWAVEMPHTGPGDTVVILGPGQRGLASVLACREAGASKIIVTGLAADAKKLALAAAFGADHTVDVENEDAKRRIQELTDGEGARVVVDVSSYSTAPVAEALDYVAPGGTVVLAGVKGWKPIPEFISDKIVLKEIELRGAIGVTSSGYRRAIELIESRRQPDRAHAHPRLRPARRRARDPHARAPGARRRIDPLLSAALDARVTASPSGAGSRSRPTPRRWACARASSRASASCSSFPSPRPNSNPGKALHGGCAASLAAVGGQAVTRLALGEESGPWHTCALQVGYLSAAIDEDVVASARRCCARASSSASSPSRSRRGTASPSRTPRSVVRARLAAPEAKLHVSAGDDGASDPGQHGSPDRAAPVHRGPRHPGRAHDGRHARGW